MAVIVYSFNIWDTTFGDDKEPHPTRDSMGNVISLADSQVVLGWKHRNVDTLGTIVLCVQDNLLILIQHVLKDSKA